MNRLSVRSSRQLTQQLLSTPYRLWISIRKASKEDRLVLSDGHYEAKGSTTVIRFEDSVSQFKRTVVVGVK